MAFDKIEFIKETLINAVDEINTLLKLENISSNVLTLQFLVPDSIHFKGIERYAIYQKNDQLRKRYENSINQFVGLNNENKPTRSLYFLKYNESYKYRGDWDNKESFNHDPSYDFLIDQEKSIVLIDEETKLKLSDSSNIPTFWEEWCKYVKLLPCGATLWSYVNFRLRDGQNISSAYLTLSKSIGKKEEGVVPLINKILQDYLISYSIEIFSSELKQREFEKEQVAREKMLYVGMGHYVKNSTIGLEEHENEIIQHLKKEPNLDERILILAQLQKLVYRLIRLYLQIRQISSSGVVDKRTKNTIVNINLLSFINLIYLHIIIARGRFYIALDNPSNLALVKELTINQINKIEGLTNILQNQTFAQNDINTLLSDDYLIQNFHILSKHGFDTLLRIDESLNVELLLNSIQFKYLYAVFTEIFDNCFSNKHSSGSRVAFLYLNSNADNHRTVIISSRDSSFDIENKFKFENDSLCKNCVSTGNGIKIIQSALANEYMKSDLLIPINSEPKSFPLSNGGEVSIYEYNIQLNNHLFK